MGNKYSQKIFKNNKYTRWYFSIISNRKTRILSENIYTEIHHIVPKSMGGTNYYSNLIELTAKEHFLVHWLLTKMCIKSSDTRKMQYAMRSMSWDKTGKRIIFGWQFELSRKKVSESSRDRKVSESTKEKISKAGKSRFALQENRIAMRLSKLNSVYSKHTDETKKKISESAKERYKSEENRIKTSEATKKAQSSDEFRRKRSITAKQRYQERPELRELVSKQFKGKSKSIVECPHCGKNGGTGPMNRWHFDNCKLRGQHYSLA